MKKVFTIILMALAITALFVSCDDPKHEHSFDADKWESDGTSHWHVCTTCGEKLDVADHTLETTKAKEPTCTESGWDEYVTCSICGYSTYKEKPAQHTIVKHEAQAATCTEKGWDAYETCSKCAYSTYKEIAALGHDVTSEGKCTRCTADNFEIAQIGNKKYTSLTEAFTAAGKVSDTTDTTGTTTTDSTDTTDTTTIKLLQNITLTESIEVKDGLINLDLDGKVIKASENKTINVSEVGGVGLKNVSPSQEDFIRSEAKFSVSNDKTTVYYCSFDVAVSAVGTEEVKLSIDTITLLKNVSLSKTVTILKGVTIDLDGKTVTLAVSNKTKENVGAFELLDANAAYTVTVKNGKITGAVTGKNDKSNAFSLNKNAALALDGVVMDVTCKRGIQVRDYSQNAKISVKNSTLKVKDGKEGVYVIATNAAVNGGDTSKGITIDISDSTLEAFSVENDNCGSTALLLNVPGDYTITNSIIKGERQAAIFRGGTYTVSGSTFEYTTNHTHNSSCESSGWGNGNDVPNAAIVIGNKTKTEYAYPTTVTFTGTNTLTVPTSGGYQLYVYQYDATDARKVKVSGNDNSWTVNSDRNGADYPTAKIGNTTYSTLQAAIDAVASDGTITLLCDTTGSGLVTKDSTDKTNKPDRNITIDFAGHTYTMRDPAVGSSSTTATQAMHWGESATSITMKNGTFKIVENAENVKMACQNYTNFTGENMTFNFESVQVQKYDSSAGEDWEGKEIAMFVHNVNRTGADTKLRFVNSIVKLPKESNRGIAVNCPTMVLENTTINGYVDLNESKSVLTVDSKSKVTKEVISTKTGYKVSSTVEDNITKYTTVAETQ